MPSAITLFVKIDGQDRAMCCAGCQAVAETIVASGLEQFYQHRTEPSSKPDDLVPDFLEQVSVYDEPEIQSRFVRSLDTDQREAALILEGITCAACVWMNEMHLKALPGVIDIQANFTTRRLRVRWDNRQIKLSTILNAIHNIGYQAHPYDPQQHQQIMDRERKTLLKRLGIAGVLGMQVMMLAVTLYTGDFSAEDTQYKTFFHWLSLLLTLPVVLYSARAFFNPAWRDLKQKKLGMDVPVSLGILIAFLGSIYATVSGQGHVYYDSVCMFTFFLLTARYLELLARKRATETSENLLLMTPATAIRLNGDSQETIPVARLQINDRVLVKPGDTVPADGIILSGQSTLDESLLSGESLPVFRTTDALVFGGSINIESPLTVRVEKVGQDSLLSRITDLMAQSQAEKPRITIIADRVARWFVPIILLTAAAIGLSGWLNQNPHWFESMIALLVVTCPCALSLATPVALTVATDTLMKLGLISSRGHAIETLARADRFVFDKTGTLTQGKLSLHAVIPLSDLSEQATLTLAAALEAQSEHPIAQTLINAASGDIPTARDLINTPGAGIRGSIADQQYVIGTLEHIDNHSHAVVPESLSLDLEAGQSALYLANQTQLLAVFLLSDELRDDAQSLVDALHKQKKTVALLSGDNQNSVDNIARKLGIKDVRAACRPDEKLAQLQHWQADGSVVAMIGDGINDAPTLAGAQVSIAMGSGAQIARANADLILLSNSLPTLAKAILVAQKTMRIVQQNMAWAIGYNLIALPLAAFGYIEPWMAAIGMSLSSLIVVSNALRIKSLKA